MGIKKYEIITVGRDKRVRALRSWQVGDRYVNIGDVGGIVYDEKTLSQDGACWLFRGNFNFPGARIGGDSIVDIGEEVPDVNSPTPDLNILGSSVVVGSKVRFSVTSTAADAVTLTAADFEQGNIIYSKGANWETWKVNGTIHLRTKAPIFMGGFSATLKLDVPGYTVQAYVLDRDGIGIAVTAMTETGEGVTLAVPAGQYMVIRLTKNPVSAIVPADATAAQIKFKGAYKNTLNIIDSRVSINPVTDTANRVSVILGGSYLYTTGGEFPPCNIVGSTVNLTRNAATSRSIYIVADVENSNVSVNATVTNSVFIGAYSNVKNLVYNLPGAPTTVAGKNSIQAYNCDNMVISLTNFPGLAAMQTAGVPIRFYSCNLNAGRFYHHAQIANTYRDINFDLAVKDLGKVTVNGYIMGSSEVNGMYRLYSTTGSIFGAMVESHESIKSLNMTGGADTYGTTIYADAYLNGLFDLKGTNVFGNSMKHDASNTQDISGVLVNGLFNATTNGTTISGVVANNARAVVSQPFRISGAGGISVQSPAGVECNIYLTDAANTILVNTGYKSGDNAPATLAPTAIYAYIAVRKADGSDILSLDDVKGVTVTTYNGCKLVNTGETEVSLKGNIRVEDNATLINTSITGTGYFGGNANISGAFIGGCVYMRDNASFTKTAGTLAIRNLKMTENAYAVLGNYPLNGRIHLSDNARCTPTAAGLSGGDLVMKDNAVISGAVAVDGVITMKDNAKVSSGTLSAYGDITFCGSYNQTVNKTWTGKRTITDVNEPEYDNNVKTQYDF